MRQLIMAVCGVGVVLLIAGIAAGKDNTLPYLGGSLLLLWVTLEVWWQTRRRSEQLRLPNDTSPGGIYTQLRNRIFKIPREDLGIASPPIQSPIWAAIMETGTPKMTITLLALSDGSTSLYLSTGGGVIGGQPFETVRKANAAFLEIANGLISHLKKADSPTLPESGQATFYAITDAGILTASAASDELTTGRHILSPLFYAGHGVITEIRKLSEAGRIGIPSSPNMSVNRT